MLNLEKIRKGDELSCKFQTLFKEPPYHSQKFEIQHSHSLFIVKRGAFFTFFKLAKIKKKKKKQNSTFSGPFLLAQTKVCSNVNLQLFSERLLILYNLIKTGTPFKEGFDASLQK